MGTPPSVMDRIKARRCYPVKLGDETVHVRALTIGELKALDKLPPEQQTGFAIGCALVEQDGKQQFPRLERPIDANATPHVPQATRQETNEEFAARMLEAVDEFPADNLKDISEAIGKLIRVPMHADLVKN